MGCMDIAQTSLQTFWVPELSRDNAKEKEEEVLEEKRPWKHFFSVHSANIAGGVVHGVCSC
jgi:hypothetical protein